MLHNLHPWARCLPLWHAQAALKAERAARDDARKQLQDAADQLLIAQARGLGRVSPSGLAAELRCLPALDRVAINGLLMPLLPASAAAAATSSCLQALATQGALEAAQQACHYIVEPWMPGEGALLTDEERKRGVTYAGSGTRLRTFAGKLLAGQPVRVAAVGGSITAGHGAQVEAVSYPWLFFSFLNATFPTQQG